MRVVLLLIGTGSVLVALAVGGWAGLIFAGVVLAIVIAGSLDEHYRK